MSGAFIFKEAGSLLSYNFKVHFCFHVFVKIHSSRVGTERFDVLSVEVDLLAVNVYTVFSKGVSQLQSSN